MPSSTLTSKGQITIPRAIRERLGMKQGDRLEFAFEGDRVVLHRAESTPAVRIAGVLAHLRGRRPVTAEGMRDAVRRRARAKSVKGRRG
jgi:AbrB family looped-hinge helix DNA binding protein